MAAEEFVLIPKHTYIREQRHTSQVLLNSSIKQKKPQLSYLNRMRPLIPTKQNSVSTETLPLPLPPTPPSTPIVDPGEQLTGLLTEDETNQYQEGGEEEEKRIVDEKERNDNKINYERILLQLQIMEEKKFTRVKNILEVIKSSTRVSINAMDETIYVDNVPTASFLYDIQQHTKILHNPAYIMILSALELTEESVINKYAKHAVQSKIKEQAQRRTKSPTKSPSTSGKTKTLDSSKPSSRSKQTKRLKTRKKATTERVKETEKDEDDTESYGTPYNDSDSSTSEKTETKSKRWETYTN